MTEPQLTLLIVDDAKPVRAVLIALAQMRGWRSFEAVDGVDGLAILERESVDTMITDLRMPRMGGLELVERARSLRPNLRIITMTGYHDHATRQRCLDLGADEHLEKPFRNIREIAVMLAGPVDANQD